MAVTGITLADPVSGLVSVIKPRAGVAFQGLQMSPAVRAVTEDRVGADGASDTSAFLSAAAVSLNLALYDALDGSATTRSLLDEIGALLDEGMRPALIVDDDQWAAPRQLTVRFDSITNPIVTGNGRRRDVQVSWTAPAGVWEAAPVSAVIGAYIASSTGLSIDPPPGGYTIGAQPGGLVIASTSAASPSQVLNPGGKKVQWTALLYGPCTGPAFASDTTGQQIVFTSDLVLNPGDYIALGSDHTAYLNGDVTQSVADSLDFPDTGWWLVQPGMNVLRYFPQTAGPGAVAVISFSPAWQI